jgi:hypothetical protein
VFFSLSLIFLQTQRKYEDLTSDHKFASQTSLWVKRKWFECYAFVQTMIRELPLGCEQGEQKSINTSIHLLLILVVSVLSFDQSDQYQMSQNIVNVDIFCQISERLKA